MNKTTSKIINIAFKTIRTTNNYNIHNANKSFSRKYLKDAIEDLQGYLSTLYKYGNMKETDFNVCYSLVIEFYIAMERMIDEI